jgi:hypothetical protein
MNNKLLFALIVCTAGFAHAGDLYRWTDAQGVMHFSDTPPPQSQVDPAKVKVDRNKISDADSTLNAAPKPGDNTAAPNSSAPAAPPRNNPATAAVDSNRMCDQARSNVQLLQGSYPVADASGKMLDDNARAAMLEQAKRTAATCR